ncbi:MAG: ABC transporter ATP-binding protein [Terricaulis sp.]
MPTPPPEIVARLDGVAKSYAGRPVLNDFDFELEAGSVVALLGPNGAGKSTVAGLITGRLAADAGKISLFDRDPRNIEARARMGVMLQASGLPEALTVAEAVALHAGYFKRRLKTKDILEQAGLTSLAKRRCDKLSGGEQRRVQFALAIAGAPDFLVLDEPTTGFDGEARRAMWRLVREKANAGVAVLLATHHMDEAEALADRIVVIADGKIIADGPPTAIKAKVAGSTIRLRTTLSTAHLQLLPGAAKVDQLGADTAILTTNARATLEGLFGADPALTDFEVASASLEDALADIIANTRKEAA